MYTATMEYSFLETNREKICQIWKDKVLKEAEQQPGFVRMQFLCAKTHAMAIGTWQEESNAQDFMKTGVFVKLMEDLSALLTEEPRPRIWELKYFSEA